MTTKPLIELAALKSEFEELFSKAGTTAMLELRNLVSTLLAERDALRSELSAAKRAGEMLAESNESLRATLRARDTHDAARCAAEERAMKIWEQEHSGEMARPDHADLLLYMGERLEELEDVISRSCSEMQAALTPIFETTPPADEAGENRRGEPVDDDEHYVRICLDGNAWSTRVALEARSLTEIFTYATVDQGGGEVDLERYKADFLRRIADTELVPITEWEK